MPGREESKSFAVADPLDQSIPPLSHTSAGDQVLRSAGSIGGSPAVNHLPVVQPYTDAFVCLSKECVRTGDRCFHLSTPPCREMIGCDAAARAVGGPIQADRRVGSHQHRRAHKMCVVDIFLEAIPCRPQVCGTTEPASNTEFVWMRSRVCLPKYLCFTRAHEEVRKRRVPWLRQRDN